MAWPLLVFFIFLVTSCVAADKGKPALDDARDFTAYHPNRSTSTAGDRSLERVLYSNHVAEDIALT